MWAMMSSANFCLKMPPSCQHSIHQLHNYTSFRGCCTWVKGTLNVSGGMSLSTELTLGDLQLAGIVTAFKVNYLALPLRILSYILLWCLLQCVEFMHRHCGTALYPFPAESLLNWVANMSIINTQVHAVTYITTRQYSCTDISTCTINIHEVVQFKACSWDCTLDLFLF